MNIRAPLIHALGDVIVSSGVFVVSIIIKFFPGAAILDPICAFLFCIMVAITTKNVFFDALHILLEGAPADIAFDDVYNDLLSLREVEDLHDLRMWKLTTDKTALNCHLAVGKKANKEKVLQEATKMLRAKYDITFLTIQIELFRAEVMNCCDHCKALA